METKYCPDCQTDLPFSEFGRNRSTKDGLTSYCRPHHAARGAYAREKNGGSRRYHMRRRYGIDLEEYEALLLQQNNQCAICKIPDPTHIDHDHIGKAEKHVEGERVRGILCTACNNGLGLFRDNPEFLIAAAAYLRAGDAVILRAS